MLPGRMSCLTSSCSSGCSFGGNLPFSCSSFEADVPGILSLDIFSHSAQPPHPASPPLCLLAPSPSARPSRGASDPSPRPGSVQRTQQAGHGEVHPEVILLCSPEQRQSAHRGKPDFVLSFPGSEHPVFNKPWSQPRGRLAFMGSRHPCQLPPYRWGARPALCPLADWSSSPPSPCHHLFVLWQSHLCGAASPV